MVVVGPVGAQYANHLAQVLQCAVSIAADHTGGAGNLRGRGVRPKLQRSGLQTQQRQAMGEHVVHFPGDSVALHLSGLGDVRLEGVSPFQDPLATHQCRAGMKRR